jgi:sarcosine/dimethylglycine N-methyltransferase
MQADDCPEGVLQPVLERIHLDSLGSIAFYREAAARHGLEEVEVLALTENLITHEPLAKRPKPANFLAIQGQKSRVCLAHCW